MKPKMRSVLKMSCCYILFYGILKPNFRDVTVNMTYTTVKH